MIPLLAPKTISVQQSTQGIDANGNATRAFLPAVSVVASVSPGYSGKIELLPQGINPAQVIEVVSYSQILTNVSEFAMPDRITDGGAVYEVFESTISPAFNGQPRHFFARAQRVQSTALDARESVVTDPASPYGALQALRTAIKALTGFSDDRVRLDNQHAFASVSSGLSLGITRQTPRGVGQPSAHVDGVATRWRQSVAVTVEISAYGPAAVAALRELATQLRAESAAMRAFLSSKLYGVSEVSGIARRTRPYREAFVAVEVLTVTLDVINETAAAPPGLADEIAIQADGEVFRIPAQGGTP